MRYPVSRPCIGPLERNLVNDCLDRVSLSQGEMVRSFEEELSEYLQTRFVVATTSGTTALHLALVALDIGPGDEVLVPDVTFVATANAVEYTGATPVLVDIDPRSWCIDVEDMQRKITSRTRAIIPVHLYGVACDMLEILNVAARFNLRVVEDAAEGFTGMYDQRMLGTLGHAGVYSFFGNKIITCGEGGAVSTDDERLWKKLCFYRGQAQDPKRRYYHPEIGFNYRMTELQAALGVGQLAHLRSMLTTREMIFDAYNTRLKDYGEGPKSAPYTKAAPWLYTMRLDHGLDREGLMARLADRGIETRPGFVPLHRLPMYSQPEENFPVASHVTDRLISLPTHADMTIGDVHTICNEFMECV